MSERHHVVTLYGKKECCLCNDALACLEAVRKQLPFELIVHDITGNTALLVAYGASIPVVLIDGVEHFHYCVDASKLRQLLE